MTLYGLYQGPNDERVETIDLKPCPFCGSSDLFLWSSKWGKENREYYGVECRDCHARIQGSPRWAEKWNRRVVE